MKKILSLTKIGHGHLGPEYRIKLSDGTEIIEVWETLFIRYGLPPNRDKMTIQEQMKATDEAMDKFKV